MAQQKSKQATEFQQITTSYTWKGLVIKQDPALLTDGQFSEFSNMASFVEGQITTRNGHRRLTSGNTFNLIQAIAKLRDASGNDYYYLGSSSLIYRSNGPIPPTGASMTTTLIADFCCDPSIDYYDRRFAAIRYNAGSTGKPWEFFACPLKMLKDTGTLTNSGDGSGDGVTVIQRWGIIPPTFPVFAALDVITLLPSSPIITGSGRTNTTITALSGSAPGLMFVAVNDLSTIVPYMMLVVGGQQVRVEGVGPLNFNAYFVTAPTVGASVISGEQTFTATLTTGTTQQYTVAVPGAEFNGVPGNGYSTDDVVHFSIGIASTSSISDMRLRVMVNSATGTDYYEKEILQSQVQSQVSLTGTSTSVLPTVTTNISTGVTGPYGSDVSVVIPSQALFLNQLSPYLSGSAPVWTEFDIPKSQFLPVGNAGSGQYSWNNVQGFQVLAIGSGTVWVGSIYIAGGFGPNAVSTSANVPLLPYTYLYTYLNTVTGQQSNPSPLMIPPLAAMPRNQGVALSIATSTDNQISNSPTTPSAATNPGSIVIYRQGGSFSDGLYRLIGYASNVLLSGGAATEIKFVDNQSDGSIIGAPIISFDNDPPVTSTLPVPFQASFSAYVVGGGNVGFNQFSVTTTSGPSLSDLTTFLNVGSVITIAPNTSVQEVCAVVAVTSNTITTVFQYNHATATSTGIFVTCNSVVGQPCNLALNAFDSVFLAGDVNNPHVLYKSKTGTPEAFPVIELATGIADQINVGSPSDPIVNLTEYNGQVLCMNSNDFYMVSVFLGQMQTPIKANLVRGLYSKNAWCKVEDEIWYLAYDGIYSWSGGTSKKRSEAIDPLFKGIGTSAYQPINLGITPLSSGNVSGKNAILFTYSKQRVYVDYVDTSFVYHRLRYDILYDRWAIDTLSDNNVVGALFDVVTATYTDPDYGFGFNVANNTETISNVLLGKSIDSLGSTIAYLYMDDVGSSDGWVDVPTDGAPISYSFQTAAYTLGKPSLQKQYSDQIIEMNNDNSIVTVLTYYDFSTTQDSTDQFVIAKPSSPLGRRRVFLSLQNGFGKEAYAMQNHYAGFTTAGVTFYTTTFNFFPLDQLQSGRSFDWDDLGSPDDKRLFEISIWYDAKSSAHTWDLDVITGIGNTQTVHQSVQQFVLEPLAGTFTGPSWTQVTFPINDNIVTNNGIPSSIVKKVRLRPNSVDTPYSVRTYNFNFEALPPDSIFFTSWTTFGWKCDKIARNLMLDINTGGVAAIVSLQADGNTMQIFSITSSISASDVVLACNSNLIGKQWRLALTPGSGGQTQLFDWGLDYVREPCAVTYFDSYENDFGYPGWKAMKQVFLWYTSPSPLTLTFFVDNDLQFYQVTLPAQAHRDIRRFYFPASNGGVLNKSKQYRLQINSANSFKLYSGSLIEFIQFGSDQMGSFKIIPQTPETQAPVDPPQLEQVSP